VRFVLPSTMEIFNTGARRNFPFDIEKDWKITFEEEFRLGDDAGHLYYHHSDLGFVYKSLADWIDLGVNYRKAFEKDSKDKWRQENRPHLNVTLKGKLLGLDLSDRSRRASHSVEILFLGPHFAGLPHLNRHLNCTHLSLCPCGRLSTFPSNKTYPESP